MKNIHEKLICSSVVILARLKAIASTIKPNGLSIFRLKNWSLFVTRPLQKTHNGIMGGIIRLGGRFSVIVEGVELPHPPTKSTSVLLCGLGSQGEVWTERSDLAAKMFPDQPKGVANTALRQTLHRLQTWLDKRGVEVERNRVRLSPGFWEVDLIQQDGNHGQIAPGLEHPWMTQIRSRLTRVNGLPRSDTVQIFVESVLAASDFDPEVGRSLLLGGDYLVHGASAAQVKQMMAVTKPSDAKDSLSAEYSILASLLSFRFGNLQDAYSFSAVAYRIAVKKRQRLFATSAAAFALFMALELYRVDDAIAWREILSVSERSLQSRMLVTNAIFVFHWHFNQNDDALQAIQKGREFYRKADRRDAMHIWTNVAVYACEIRNHDLAKEAFKIIDDLILTSMDFWFEKSYRLAVANFARISGDPARANQILLQLESDCQQGEFTFTGLYASEARAEALSDLGRTEEARALWLECEQKRIAMGSRSSDRLQRSKERVWQIHD